MLKAGSGALGTICYGLANNIERHAEVGASHGHNLSRPKPP